MRQATQKQLAALLSMLFIISGCNCIARTPAEFENITLEVVEPVVANEVFNVRAEVVNKGGTEGIYTAVLKIDGQEVNSIDIEVPAESVREILFPVIAEEPGTRTLEVGGTSTTIKVLEPAELRVINLKMPLSVFPGEEVVITATAKNLGEVTGLLTPALYVNDVKVDSRNLTLKPGAAEDISFSIVRDLPGDYKIDISGALYSTKTLRVRDVVPYYNEQYGFSMMRPREWQLKEYHDRVVIQNPGQAMFIITVEMVDEEQSFEDLYKSYLGAWIPRSIKPPFAWIAHMGKAEDGSEILGYKTAFIYKDTSGESIHRHLELTKIGPHFYTLALTYVYPHENKSNVGLYLTCLHSFKFPGLVNE